MWMSYKVQNKFAHCSILEHKKIFSSICSQINGFEQGYFSFENSTKYIWYINSIIFVYSKIRLKTYRSSQCTQVLAFLHLSNEILKKTFMYLEKPSTEPILNKKFFWKYQLLNAIMYSNNPSYLLTRHNINVIYINNSLIILKKNHIEMSLNDS